MLRNYAGDHIRRELPRQHRAGQTHLGQDGGIRAGQGGSTHSAIPSGYTPSIFSWVCLTHWPLLCGTATLVVLTSIKI